MGISYALQHCVCVYVCVCLLLIYRKELSLRKSPGSVTAELKMSPAFSNLLKNQYTLFIFKLNALVHLNHACLTSLREKYPSFPPPPHFLSYLLYSPHDSVHSVPSYPHFHLVIGSYEAKCKINMKSDYDVMIRHTKCL